MKLGLNQSIGVSHYNLGNYYRSRSEYKESIHHYSKARIFEPGYLKQHYFYSELGGVLFDSGRYRCSAVLYKRALEKGAPERNIAQYADALMLSGRYQQAHQQFSYYLESFQDDRAEWELKIICLENLISTTKEQVRHNKEANKILESIEESDPLFANSLHAALEKDALSPFVRLKIGVIEYEKKNHDEAILNFTIAALVLRWDIEIWVNATLLCFSDKKYSYIMSLIVSTAYSLNSEDYSILLYEKMAKTLDGEILDNITNLIEELLLKEREDDMKKVRIMHEDGIYRNILST